MSIIFPVSYFNYLSQRHFHVFFNNELSLVCNKNILCSMTCWTGSPKNKSEERALDPIQKINMGEKKMEKRPKHLCEESWKWYNFLLGWISRSQPYHYPAN